MTELETKLAEALRLISFASMDRGARDTATEALRLYEQAKAQPVQDLPPLPDTDLAEIRNPYTGEATVSETGTAYYGSNWYEVRKLYTADQMHAYARAALAATPAPAPAQARKAISHMADVEFPKPRQQETPCPECHLQPGERCDICGALAATPAPVTLADVLDALNLFNRPKPSEDDGPWEAGHFIRVDYLPAFINIIADAWFSRPKTAQAQQAATPAPVPLLVELDYAIAHGWPSESLARLEGIRNADKAATPAPAPGWQPIETAPKKGPAVLLFGSRSGRAFIGTWGDYCGFNQPRITHWMPLPAAPGAGQGKEASNG